MKEIVATNSEISRVIASACAAHYTECVPEAVAGRLARLHQAVWEAVVTGAPAGDALADLRRQASRLFDEDALIQQCDRRVVRDLTPVIAASLACGPGEDRIRLRDIEAAMYRLLDEALAHAGPAARAA